MAKMIPWNQENKAGKTGSDGINCHNCHKKEKVIFIVVLFVILALQLASAIYFCTQKQGFHYDEYYSYYSSNKTYGLIPTDREWKDTDEIISEFIVRPGEGFQYELVKTMQSFDVHPPLYYMVLHTVCSLFPGSFTKWTGLSVNLVFFVICYWMMAYISYYIFKKDRRMTAVLCLLFGFQPGVISGITFIRMYMMLTMWCLALILWHIPAWRKELKLTPSSSILLFVIVLAGFLTHYYFAVFLFFMAAFHCLYHWLVRKNLKNSILYGSIICLAMGTAVILYPASLSHIFRGYRGTEATEAFFDWKNTFLRLDFFMELMDESVFGGGLSFFILLWILILLPVMRKKKGRIFSFLWQAFKKEEAIFHLAFSTAGYFLVVAKTALLNAEEANRYQLPVYGLCMLLVAASFYYLRKGIEEADVKIFRKISPKVPFYGGIFLAVAVLFLQGKALADGKVQFLYKEDKENIEWAFVHKEAPVLYFYNPLNQWMIWDEAGELMQYDEIYFVSLADDASIQDQRLLKEDEIYVYASRMEEAEAMMKQLMTDNSSINKIEKIRELLYCDLYRLGP